MQPLQQSLCTQKQAHKTCLNPHDLRLDYIFSATRLKLVKISLAQCCLFGLALFCFVVMMTKMKRTHLLMRNPSVPSALDEN